MGKSVSGAQSGSIKKVKMIAPEVVTTTALFSLLHRGNNYLETFSVIQPPDRQSSARELMQFLTKYFISR